MKSVDLVTICVQVAKDVASGINMETLVSSKVVLQSTQCLDSLGTKL